MNGARSALCSVRPPNPATPSRATNQSLPFRAHAFLMLVVGARPARILPLRLTSQRGWLSKMAPLDPLRNKEVGGCRAKEGLTRSGLAGGNGCPTTKSAP